jgi:CDP-glycerol glycerophosphotransferase (TagB/SpsB family)
MPETGRTGLKSLNGLRILYLRGPGDDAGLDVLLGEATRDLGWQVETLRPDLTQCCKRQSFEADSDAVAEIDALIRDCERTSGVPAGRILAADGRDLGRGFSAPDVLLEDSAIARSVLTDNAEPFRILRRMFAHARDAIAACGPDLLVFGGRADAWYFVFRLVARQTDVDALSLRRSRLWAGRRYWTNDIEGLNRAARALALSKRVAHAAVSTHAQNLIAQERSPGASAPEADGTASSGAEDLASLRYVYLALKEDPSESPGQSPFWANQFYMTELICSTLPAGYKLLVHEHPDNTGRRPAAYHRDLLRLPNVVLIDGAEDARPYIANAAVVVTDDSPAGWQALLLGRPVIALAENFYTAADLARRVDDPENLAEAIVETLTPTLLRDASNDPRKLGWLLDAEWETSAPVDGDPEETFKRLQEALLAPVDGEGHGLSGQGRHAQAPSASLGSVESPHASPQGLRMLAVLPLGNKDLGKYLVGLIAAGKERFGWTVSVLSSTADTRSFAKLVAPQGEIFVQPPLLRAAEWESDPKAAHEVLRAIRTAESKTGMPLGRVILAAGHSIGRAYSAPFQYFNRYPMLLRVMRDNSEPYRIARRLFHFADDMLERNRPDLLFFFHWGTPLNLLTWLAAQRRGIPCVVLRPSKIRHDHAFLTTDRLMWNTAAAENARARIRVRAPVSDAARDRIHEFRTRPDTIGYISRKWSNRMNLGFFRWHKQYVRIVMTQIANRFRGQDRSTVEGVFARMARYYRTLFLSGYQQRLFKTFEPSELAAMKYVYFPMHKEAELAQLLQATAWHDQRQTIRAIASALPFGYRLLVREHRMNYGRRRTRAYRELLQLPNVTLIDAFDTQFKYLQHADLVVTENGSSGWEALLLTRQTLLLADRTFYEGCGLGMTVTEPDKLPAALVDLLLRPAEAPDETYDHALAATIDAEHETTFPMNPDGFDAALDMFADILAPRHGGLRAPRAAAAAGS